MFHRTASLLSSLAVAILALTLTASLWRAQNIGRSRGPALVPGAASCECPPALPPCTHGDCIA